MERLTYRDTGTYWGQEMLRDLRDQRNDPGGWDENIERTEDTV